SPSTSARRKPRSIQPPARCGEMDPGFRRDDGTAPRSSRRLVMSQTASAVAPPSGNEPILLQRIAEGIATLTLNRPAARNALSMALMSELIDALAALEADPAVKVVVIAAAGPAFCAGHDLKELRSDPRREAYEATFARCSQLMLALTHLPKPVIARVQGMATAAGCQLVATCALA